MNNNNNKIDYDKDPRLNILHIADLCNIKYNPKPYSNGRFYANCPFCQTYNRTTLSLTVEHGTFKNVYKCYKCGEKGTAVELYGKLKGISTKEAFKELINDNKITDNIKIKKMVELSKTIIDNVEPKDIDKLNKVYRALLDILKLNKRDYNDLKGRGLSDDIIKKNKYRSLPKFNDSFDICEKLISLGYDLNDIPGFFTYKNRWAFFCTEGYLIPIKNMYGEIYSLQVRLSNPKGKLRYIFFSSVKNANGSKALVGPNISFGKSKEVYITEGPLKGDIASFLTNKTFISVPGVTSRIDKLIEVLKEINPIHIVIAFDMDFLENEHVNNAFNSLILKLNEVNMFPEIRLWSSDLKYKNEVTGELKKSKGIDDYCLYLKQNNLNF
ncbi:CHC2 zinc finger domain-containing protein [Clostridium thermobutyricum]|uniref:CHC2 zinc finger domain-containing protein n=1 Tax=Clostridium thermobutyricum TaxID=29372 RepID=UPI0018ABC618|nr:CHC2 zinc finger domain-containing protein [Clostridium thermobutyricum]